MTPPAATNAGHAQKLRRKRSPVVPRRVSGPAGGRSQGAVADPVREPGGAPGATPRTAPRTAPRVAQPRHRQAHGASVAVRVVGFVRALPDHPLLDRVVRGRAWIPLLGLLLAGIVAMQVEVLKLGASMGRSISRTTALQSRNQLLRASVASLADEARIEQLAAGMGMVMPAPAAVGFLSGGSANNGAQAASNIHTPDSTSFLAALASTEASAAATPGQVATPPATSTTAASAVGTTVGPASSTAQPQVTPSSSTQTPSAPQSSGTAASTQTSAGSTGGPSSTVTSQSTTPVSPSAPVQTTSPSQTGTTSGGAAPAGG